MMSFRWNGVIPIYIRWDYLESSSDYIVHMKEDVTIDSETKVFGLVKPWK